MTEDIFEAAIRRLGALPVVRPWLAARIRGRHPFFGALLLKAELLQWEPLRRACRKFGSILVLLVIASVPLKAQNPTRPQITDPAPGSTLSSSSAISWSSGTGVTEYFLTVSAGSGADRFWASQSLGMRQSATVSDLQPAVGRFPTDGSPVTVRLSWLINGSPTPDNWTEVIYRAGSGLQAGITLKISLLRVVGPDGDEIQHRFGETQGVFGTLVGFKGGKQLPDTDPGVNPAAVHLLYDGMEVAQGSSNTASGQWKFQFTFPNNTPTGRSAHQFKVIASRAGLPPAEATQDVEVWRDLQKIVVTANSPSGTHPVGSIVTLTGNIAEAKSNPFTFSVPVPSQINVSVYDSHAPPVKAQTGPDGSFSIRVPLSANVPPGFPVTYVKTLHLIVKAVPLDANRYEDGQATVEIHSDVKGELQATIFTDKAVYQDGDTVHIAGKVLSDGKPVGASVLLAVEGLAPVTVQTDASGRYQWSVSPASQRLSGGFPMSAFYNQYRVVAKADASGYISDYTAAVFVFAPETSSCIPLQMVTTGVNGHPVARGLDAIGAAPANVNVGSRFPQGMLFSNEGKDDRINLAGALGGNGRVTIGIGPQTQVKIGKFCKDASGTYRLILYTNAPGKLFVDMQGDPTTKFNATIFTPSAQIQDQHTRYYIVVDERGTTTVVSLDGAVRVSDPAGSTSVDLPACRQVSVLAGGRVSASSVSPASDLPSATPTSLGATPNSATCSSPGSGQATQASTSGPPSSTTTATNAQIQPLTSFSSPSALACKAACDSNPNCQAWSWERMRSGPETERKKPSTKEGDKEKRSQGRERSDKDKKDKKDTDESDAQRQATLLGEGGTCTLFSSVEGQLNSSCVSGVKPGVPGAGPSLTTPPGGQPTPQPCPPGQVPSAQGASSSAPILVDQLTIRQGPDVKAGNACTWNACVDSTAVLEAGRQYAIEVSGVLLPDKTKALYKGYYDLDAVWAFGGDPAQWSAIMPRALYSFFVDGKSMKDISGQDVPYNPTHVYRINYVGQGKRVTFNLSDDEGISEHPLGALTVAIYSAQGGTGCVPAPTQTAQGSQPTNPMYPGAPPPPPPAGENPFPPQPPPPGENPYPPTSPNPVGTPAPTPTSTPGGTTSAYCPPDPSLLDEQIIQALPDRFTEADTMLLQAGQQYVIEAAGVFGYWDTQNDGVDPVWCYAQWRCGTGQMWQSLQLDGKGMKDINGQDIPYNPAHVYRIFYTGQGKTVHIAIQGPHAGMHGALRVRIYDASVATTALVSPPCLPTPGGTVTAMNPPPPVSYPPPAPTSPTSGTPPPPVATNTPPSSGSSCNSWPAAPGAPGGPITTATSAPPGTGQPAPPAPPTGQPPAPPVATNAPSGPSCGSLPAAPGTPGGPVMTATSSPPAVGPPPATAPGVGPTGAPPLTPTSLTPEPSFLPTGPDITITSVNPAQAAPNTDLQATVTGTNFPGDAVIGFENLAIQIESLTIMSPNQAKIRFKVPPDATPGFTFVYMTTPDGRMAEAPFTVAGAATASHNPSNPVPPTATSPPTTNGLKLLGTSLKGYGGRKINAALCKTYCDKDPTCVGWTYVKPTSACSLMSTITERRSDKCCISGEKPGSAATSAAVPLTPGPSFLPTGPDITITSVNPAQAAPNTDLQATVTGTNFPGDAVIGFENLAIQIESLTIMSPTQAKIHFKVPPDAATGATFVYMTTPDGRMAEAPFTVTPTATASNNLPNPPSQPATTHVPVSLGPANRGNCNPYSPSLEPVEPSAPSSAPATNPGAGPTTHVPVSIGPANSGTSNPPAPAAPAPTTHVPASLTPANPPPPSPPRPQPQPSTPANQTAPNNPPASAPAQPPPSQPNENPQPQQQQPNNWLGPLVQALGGIVQGMNQGQQTSPAAAGMNAADGVNLPGYDYTGYSLPQQGWDYCQSLCAQDQNCRAFTYVKPGVQAQEGRCWLKTNYSQVVRDGCCISGVKNTSYSQPQCQPHVNQPQTSETIGAADGVNLPGSDYVWYPLSQPRWDYCQSLCAQDQRCRAFTYVKPGVQGPQARCWLKSAVPQAVRDGCCISGAKSAPAYSYPQPQASPQPPRQTGCGPRTSQPAPAPNPRPPQTAPAPRATRVRIKVIAGVSCSPDDQYTSGFPGVTVNISGAAVTTGSDGVTRFGQNPGEGIPPGTYRVFIAAPRNARIVYVRLHMTSDSGIGNIIPPAGDGSFVLSFANVSNPNSMSEYELAIRFSSPDACRSGCR